MKPSLLISWILRIVVALILGPAVYFKFSSADAAIQNFTTLGMEPSGRYIVAMLELITVLLLLTPQGVVWGAILGWGVMSGALIAHATELGFSGPAMPSALMAIASWILCAAIAFLHREKALFLNAMFGGKSHRSDTD
ncbi:DoxX family protein [Pelagicoccus sp. SDUM812003]|uniref:DoxX family protein n=1 Tax=Pelagicoccus sp. SDUM812003 TaxID=3041267 RepID=UPI00280EE2A0|nr:DoxX family protein [Pelagicoccus sp. SDUM812003]MDQ8205279.1 DoxX family protein [Pelagicoccus sp. SDUM812003]